MLLLVVVGGEDDDTVVAVTDADEGRGGLIGRIEADMVSWASPPGCCCFARVWDAGEQDDCLSGQSRSQIELLKGAELLPRWMTNRDHDRGGS
jgi:hypothetical protein